MIKFITIKIKNNNENNFNLLKKQNIKILRNIKKNKLKNKIKL